MTSNQPAFNRPLPRWALPALLTGFALLAATYSIVIPPFETPDEIWHYAFIRHVATGQGLPVSAPATDALWRQQGVQAPGYYLAAAALTAWIDQSDFPAVYARANPHAAIGEPDATINRNYLVHHADEDWPWRGSFLALHLARFFSVALGVVTLWAGYHAVALILGPRPALLGTAVVAGIPQFVFISAAASNDNAVDALAALVLWQLVALIVAPPNAERPGAPWARRFALLGVLLGLALLSKLSSLALVGLAGLTLIGLARRARSWRVIADAARWTGLPAALLGGWWYLRNWRLYGDLLAWNVWEANILLRAEHAGWATIVGELGSLFRSFWGLFGWLNVPYPAWVYQFFLAVTLLVVCGLLLAARQHRQRLFRRDAAWWAAALLIAWLGLLTVSWLRFMVVAPAAQGRYFFPAAPTLIWLVAVGVGAWRIWTLGGLIAGALAALSVVTPLWLIAPAYTPPSQTDTLPAEATPVAVVFADGIELVGVAAAPATLRPGETATVTLTWHTVATPTHDYSVFVHLLDDDGLIVAQQDTMPGGGLRPTGDWQPGDLYVESYRVQIPATAYTPDHGRWAVGLYDALALDQPRLALTATTSTGVDPALDPPIDTNLNDRALYFGAVTIAAAALPGDGATPNPVDVAFGDNVTLAGYAFTQRRLRPGDIFTVTLYWRARGPVLGDYTVFVHLLDQNRRMFGGHDDRPTPPTTAWTAATAVVADVHTFTVPPDTPPGAYQVELGLYTRPDFDRLTLLSDVDAVGADRLFLGPLRIE